MDVRLEQMIERVRSAQREHRALRLRGAGTKDFYGENLAGDILDTSAWRGNVDYEPSELVITARCGTRLSEIESALAAHDQFLAFEPPAFGGDPTIGGVIAAGLSGPRRMQAGAARDFVLGAGLLNADGELLHFGGRVMKNVAGFDVARLLCGSMGILGLITDVSLKVLPRPRAESTRCFELSASAAAQAFNDWRSKPLPISAAMWCDGQAWLRLSGAGAAVQSACATVGGEAVDNSAATNLWQNLRHQTHPFFDGNGSLWRLSLPAATSPPALPGRSLIDWGGALHWYWTDAPAAGVRALAMSSGGTAMRWKGAGTAERFHPLSPSVLEIHRRLKQRFDPNGIFNPGRLVAGL
jgi:glycolate oxidase FAD binding subunit